MDDKMQLSNGQVYSLDYSTTYNDIITSPVSHHTEQFMIQLLTYSKCCGKDNSKIKDTVTGR